MDSKARTYIYIKMEEKGKVGSVRVITPSDSADCKYDLTFSPEKEECSCMGNREYGYCKHVTRFRLMAKALLEGSTLAFTKLGTGLTGVPVSDCRVKVC